MELSNRITALLEHIDKPAFLVESDTIIHVNTKACALGIEKSMPVSQIPGINTAQTEDAAISISKATINDICYNISISDIEQIKLYILDETPEIQQLQSILNASRQLRGPLAGLSSSVHLLMESTEDSEDPDLQKLLRSMLKQLLSIQRSVRNMSDITLFLQDRTDKKETIDVTAYVSELANKTIQQLARSGLNISYTGPEDRIYCNVDLTLFERAFYNMISNALKADSQNIQIRLKQQEKMLLLSVEDDGCGIAESEISTLFSKFRDITTLNASGYGLGLGMMIIHAAANAHDGTVLIKNKEPHGCCVTLTLAIQDKPLMLRQTPSQIVIDPLGGIDPLLIELSDFLPPDYFM